MTLPSDLSQLARRRLVATASDLSQQAEDLRRLRRTGDAAEPELERYAQALDRARAVLDIAVMQPLALVQETCACPGPRPLAPAGMWCPDCGRPLELAARRSA